MADYGLVNIYPFCVLHCISLTQLGSGKPRKYLVALSSNQHSGGALVTLQTNSEHCYKAVVALSAKSELDKGWF